MHAAVLLLVFVVLEQSALGFGVDINLPYRYSRMFGDQPLSALGNVQNVKRRPSSEDDTFQRYLGFGANSIFSPRFGFNEYRQDWK
ncbi:hypothetical protein V3C99_016936 [Haemonchus contortus]|uniref:Uncharacterized protein n=2 Tax=Haemonchus TaxID=6288 RepID=A0A0N4WBV7_HAEPC|nr:unnamed protein product [Haemonchus contortus]VDO33410.1 unnamed protein product [Haemonchus placei]